MDIDAKIINHAVEDLQMWMANAPSDTTESAISAWQAGYIAGVNRAVSSREESEVEEI